MLTAPDILDLAERYAASHDPALSITTVSHRVFGDSKKLAAIRDGADLTLSRAASAVDWFSRNWPEGLLWPAHIDRPNEHGAAA